MSPMKVFNSDATAVPVVCWSCAVAQNESTLFCATCSKVQPPPGVDYFQVFSLPRGLQIDLVALEEEFHRLSRKLHPDRFARATDAEREFSLADTALINDAYRTLRDPVRRTEYLLKLEGEEIGEEHAGRTHENGPHRSTDAAGAERNSRVPADLLEEVFELNMQLDELREGDANDPDLLNDVRAAGEKFTLMLNELDSKLREQWLLWDEGDAAVRTAAQKQMVALLDRRRYLNNLLRDVKKVLGA
jgi:molecular chaperone HscB